MKTSPMTPPSEQLRDGDLWLSLPEMDDVEAVVQHAKHADMDETYWLPVRPAATKQAAEALIGELRHGWDGTGEHGAALFVRQRDGLIGGVYLRRESHGVELGYGIAPEFRNQGFATRATRLVVDWLGPTGVPLSFRTSLTNHASRRVAEKLGFEAMRLDRRKTQSGEEYREAVYEWPDARQGLAPDRASR